MRYLKSFQLALLLIILTSNLFGQVSKNLNLEGLEEEIELLLPSAVTDTTPGFVIGVIHEGKLIFSKGYGKANLIYDISNSPELNYNLGSVTKQFLGYAFAMLHMEGKLSVDDPVGKYLENWPSFDHEVTIKHLLTHTSGYREAYTMSNLAGRDIGVDRLTREECLNVVRRQPALEFVPGSRFCYNSTAYVILAEILEKITGEPSHIWVNKNILLPMGMINTYIESFVGELIPNSAESYYFDKSRGYEKAMSNRAIFGAADIYSSIDDMFHWLNNFQDQKVGGQEVMDLFLTPFELNNGTDTKYAFGIQNSLHKGVKLYSHTGAHESFFTQIRFYPEHNFGLVAISNFGGNGWIPTNKIAEYVLADYMKSPALIEQDAFDLSLDQLKKFEGSYLYEYGNELEKVTLINDTLTIWGDMQLLPLSENRFYTKNWSGQFEFIETGNNVQMVIHGDNKDSYQRIEAWTPKMDELEEYLADYVSEELETTYTLVLKDNELFVKHRWIGEVGLKPLGKDLFRSDWGWFVEFERSDENEILGFNINTGRTVNVFFEKK